MSTVATVQPKIFIQPNETTQRNKTLRAVAAVSVVAGLAIAAAALFFAAQLSVVGIVVGVAISLLSSYSFSYLRSIDGDQKLHKAAYDSNGSMVKFLLCLGANPNATNPSSETPLHLAALNENPQILRDLIAAGGNANAFTGSMINPLHNAAYNLNVESSTILLENGADPTVKAKHMSPDWSPYEWALGKQKSYKEREGDSWTINDKRTKTERVAAADQLVEIMKPYAAAKK